MPVSRLVVTDFRNFQSGEISPSPHFNFIFGLNGSGKTTVLEALSTIALGRSFRSRKYKNIIRYQQCQFSLFCVYEVDTVTNKIGVSRPSSGQSLFKLNGRALTSSLDLVNLIPLQVINSDSFQLISSTPSDRRQFLDWIVFHVKHSFQSDWRDYMHCLKQRNCLLRSATIDPLSLDTWDQKLAEHAELLDQARSELLCQYLGVFAGFCEKLDFVDPDLLDIEYLRGWSSEHDSFLSCLKSGFERDRRLGYTSQGAHKSDIKIKYHGHSVAELFSRGQLKSLSLAMFMAQVEMFARLTHRPCLLLVDDLPSELDQHNLQRVAQWLVSLKNTQVFLTAVELEPFINLWPKDSLSKSKMFHVKHGQITEQSMHTE